MTDIFGYKRGPIKAIHGKAEIFLDDDDAPPSLYATQPGSEKWCVVDNEGIQVPFVLHYDRAAGVVHAMAMTYDGRVAVSETGAILSCNLPGKFWIQRAPEPTPIKAENQAPAES